MRHVRPGQVVGLGSGSTMAIFTAMLGQESKSRRLELKVVPSSYEAYYLALENGLQVASLDEFPSPDIAFDGADQINRKLDMIKGGGGALTREKIIDAASKFVVVVVDESKLVERLGEGFPVPIEVVPMAAKALLKRVGEMGGRGRIRAGGGKVGPAVTDNGNFILDVDFGAVSEPAKLEKDLKLLPGVVEVGIFCGIADLAYVGCREGVKELPA
ncbi:MAG: ribose-5-phosphate isomerase RpiA [Candidatus Brockarchaeota archaeon]|nr:ribose-5-phosphate isomerase RpiA [Candidatus Brockarchaeota archaeon]